VARFESIHTKTWRDPDFYEWPADTKLGWLWLLTNEQATQSGLQEVHAAVMATELRVGEERVRDILQLLARAGKVELAGRLVWVVRRFDYRPNSPKVRESVLRDLRLHARSPLTRRFWKRYRQRWPEAERTSVQKELEALWSSAADGLDTVCGPSGDGPIQTNPIEVQSVPNQTGPRTRQIDIDALRAAIRAGIRGAASAKDLNRVLSE
jgi:hypothetical protein